jgi:diguanylate cyclase (GGDEF)-like protein
MTQRRRRITDGDQTMNDPIEDTIIRAPSLAALDSCRALVVAAEPAARDRLRRLTEARAFETREAASGGEAIARLHNEHCPVVVVDARLPDMSAAQLLGEVRGSIPSRYTYTMLLCDPADPAAIVAGLKAGADDCLSRSALAVELMARLESARRIAALEHGLRAACETNARIATTDRLTGAFNRRHLDRQLPRELERARRYVRPLSLLSVDLDHFKRINDEHGHAAGDRVLKAAVRVMQRRLRGDIDWVARAGGEEFVVVLPETAADGARVVAERLREAIRAEPVPTDSSAAALRVTASIGIASVSSLDEFGYQSAERLLAQADASLYRAKRLGRDRVSTFPGLRAVN